MFVEEHDGSPDAAVFERLLTHAGQLHRDRDTRVSWRSEGNNSFSVDRGKGRPVETARPSSERA